MCVCLRERDLPFQLMLHSIGTSGVHSDHWPPPVMKWTWLFSFYCTLGRTCLSATWLNCLKENES